VAKFPATGIQAAADKAAFAVSPLQR